MEIQLETLKVNTEILRKELDVFLVIKKLDFKTAFKLAVNIENIIISINNIELIVNDVPFISEQ